MKEKIEASQTLSKRVFRRQNHELCAHEQGKRLKMERDSSRSKTMLFLEGEHHTPVISLHEMSKTEMLANSINE